MIPTPDSRPDLTWHRLGGGPVVYAYEPVRGGKVWVYCFHEVTGEHYQHLCQNPPLAGRWVTHFAQQAGRGPAGAAAG